MGMSDILHEKKEKLENYLRSLGSVAVAFSSGVDSTFLLKVAHEVLGNQAAAVTIRSDLYPGRETEEASAFCRQEQIEQILLDADEMSIDGFRGNPKNRCYLCKREMFTRIGAIAKQRGFSCVAEGSNMDDNGDYRPGLTAVAELGIKSPLRYAGLYKEEIRLLSKEMGLPTWDKPSFACLASRFVYGEEITKEKLSMVDRAEQRLLELGFHQMRVRVHGTMARIEILPSEFERLLKQNMAKQIHQYFRELGFTYVSLDLGGYQTGSMNRTL